MEFEVLLFKAHKTILVNRYAKQIANYLFKISLITTFLYFIYFILLNLIQNQNHQCVNIPYYEKGENETQIFKNETYFKIFVKDDDQYLINITQTMQRFLFDLEEDILIKHNITIEDYYINRSCYCQNFMEKLIVTNSNLEILIINDLMKSTNLISGVIFSSIQKENGIIKKQVWNKNIEKEKEKSNSYWYIYFKIIQFTFKSAVYLFYITAISSLFFKLIQFGIPVLLNTGWYKLYNRILLNNNKYSPMLFIGYLSFLIILERIYELSPLLSYLFENPSALMSEKQFFILVFVNEVMSNLFFRTRSTLLYAPKFLIIYYLFNFVYIDGTIYSFYSQMATLIILFSVSTIIGFIHFYEIPAVQDWNPNSVYTPKLTRPRVFYFPLSQLQWNIDIPQIWTMFYPLYGRKFFAVENLALVDDNVELLQNYLQQNNAGQGQ